MGTRHLILVFYKGDYHIAQYGQLDGYPSGEGVRILEFASTSNNLTMLKFSISKGLLYTPTNEQLQAWKAQAFDLGQERQHQVLTNPASVNWEEHRKYPMEVVCPSIAAHISAGILQLVANSADPVPIVKHLDFIADLLYCEWAYVVRNYIRSACSQGLLTCRIEARSGRTRSRGVLPWRQVDRRLGEQPLRCARMCQEAGKEGNHYGG